MCCVTCQIGEPLGVWKGPSPEQHRDPGVSLRMILNFKKCKGQRPVLSLLSFIIVFNEILILTSSNVLGCFLNQQSTVSFY